MIIKLRYSRCLATGQHISYEHELPEKWRRLELISRRRWGELRETGPRPSVMSEEIPLREVEELLTTCSWNWTRLRSLVGIQTSGYLVDQACELLPSSP